MSASAVSSAEAQQHRGMLVKAVVASTIGTAIEWYDFFLYSTITPLVFAKLFFPNSDPLVGTLQAFLVYFVGFLARPVGAFIFGHFGDRAGRKAALISTLLLMGIATFLVAFVPGYNMIGVWGAVILTVLRFLQGVGVGGEWGGSVLLAMEWTKSFGNRGFVASWPQFGVPVGLFLANLAVLGFSAFLPQDQFLSWGWRVPFLVKRAVGACRSVDSAWDNGNSDVHPTPGRKPSGEDSGAGSHSAPTEAYYSLTTGAVGGANAVLSLYGIRFHLWHPTKNKPGSHAPGGDDICGGRVFYYPACWVHFGSNRTQAHLFNWCGRCGRGRISLHRADEYQGSQASCIRYRTRGDSAFPGVRAAGSADC